MCGRRGAYIKGCIFLASDLLVPDVCTDCMVQKWLPWPRGSLDASPKTSAEEARPSSRLPVQLTRETKSLENS